MNGAVVSINQDDQNPPPGDPRGQVEIICFRHLDRPVSIQAWTFHSRQKRVFFHHFLPGFMAVTPLEVAPTNRRWKFHAEIRMQVRWQFGSDRKRHRNSLDVFVRVQGVEVIRDAMLDMWEAELGADFTPKAGRSWWEMYRKCQIWKGLALLEGSRFAFLCCNGGWAVHPLLRKFCLIHARHELAGFLSSTIGVVHMSTSSVSRLSQTRVLRATSLLLEVHSWNILKPNIAPENKPSPQKEANIPTIHFHLPTVSFMLV